MEFEPLAIKADGKGSVNQPQRQEFDCEISSNCGGRLQKASLFPGCCWMARLLLSMAQGRSSFPTPSGIQSARRLRKPPILYYAFDLMNQNGRDLTNLSAVQTKGNP